MFQLLPGPLIFGIWEKSMKENHANPTGTALLKQKTVHA
jgi:hypothetical protein